MLDIFSKTVPMSKLFKNAHKYPKYIHSVQSKRLRNLKNRIKSTIYNNKWIDSLSLIYNAYILIFKLCLAERVQDC